MKKKKRNNIKNKKGLIIGIAALFIFVLLIVLVCISDKKDKEKINIAITMNSSLSDIKYDENKINIYMFWGDGCPHCEEEWKFLKRIAPKYYDKIHVYGFEVWKHEENLAIMEEFKNKLNLSDDIGVPLTIIGDKYFVGYDESYNEDFLDIIKNNYKNSKDIYLDKNL